MGGLERCNIKAVEAGTARNIALMSSITTTSCESEIIRRSPVVVEDTWRGGLEHPRRARAGWDAVGRR